MKIALISDVHANIVALEAVLGAIDKEGVDWIIHAGDIVGYYPFPNEVIRLFQQRGVISIRGNHDRAALNICDSNMNPLASLASRWTARHLDIVSINYLRSLRDELHLILDNLKIAVCHGSPFDRDEYVFERDVDGSLLERAGSDILILGHTHEPYGIEVESGGFIVNPGSVGQPRDGDERASWILFTTSSGPSPPKRVEYDIGRMQRAVLNEGLPSALAERLAKGE